MAISEPNTILEINEMHSDNYILVIANMPTLKFLGASFNDFTKNSTLSPDTTATSGIDNGDCDGVKTNTIIRETQLDRRNFMLYIQSITTPAVNLQNVEIPTQFATMHRPSKIQFTDLTTTMIATENMLNYNAILYWMYALHNPEQRHQLFGREMIDQYFSDIYLIITNNHRQKVAEYRLMDAYPISIDSLNLDIKMASKQPLTVTWSHSGMFPSNNFVLKYV